VQLSSVIHGLGQSVKDSSVAQMLRLNRKH